MTVLRWDKKQPPPFLPISLVDQNFLASLSNYAFLPETIAKWFFLFALGAVITWPNHTKFLIAMCFLAFMAILNAVTVALHSHTAITIVGMILVGCLMSVST